jgi:polar amino acid transport system substrate-binding protein
MAMRATYWLKTATLVLMLAGCMDMDTKTTAEARNALVPTGKLRVAFVSNSILATKDPVSGEFKGVAVDLGKELAQRLGVPYEAVPFTTFPALIAAVKTREWDVAAMGVNAERALVVDFTAPYMVAEFGYLLTRGSNIPTLADVDRAGVRIGVLEKGTPDTYLSGVIRNATLVRAATIADLVELARAQRVDALFGTKAFMLSQAEKLEGTRVIEGRAGGENHALGIPKERDLGIAFVREFIERAKSEGFVKTAIESAGLRGVVVAPPK